MSNIERIAEALLHTLSLEDILEMNDIEEVTVLGILLDLGRISQPEHLIEEYLEVVSD